MLYQVNEAVEILRRTPVTLNSLLAGLSEEWTLTNESEDSWSVFDVIGHLLEGEKKDWMLRTNIILTQSNGGQFPPFDRFAQEKSSIGKTLDHLLEEFLHHREQNLIELQSLNLSEEDLDKIGIHPEFGEVTLRQHLATWVAHDLNHLAQICRIMAKQYKDETGPWTRYLRILQS